MAEAAAREFIARRAEAGAPDLDAAIEHNLPISFATTRLQSQVYNAQPGSVAFAEPDDAVGLICWSFGKELLAKISAGFREIGDDKHALDQRQREEMLATRREGAVPLRVALSYREMACDRRAGRA